jgi:CBS domain-containing protein
LWLLPSRRRVANLQRFFAAYQSTGGSTPGMVLVDMADYADNCAAYDALELPPGWFVHYTHGETQGEKITMVWEQIVDCAWLGLIGDDCVPETPGWDKRLVDQLDGSNFVACNDGWQAPQRVGNCWVISGPLVRAVGYIFPPGLHHLYVDDVWETIGREAGCWTTDMDIMVRHLHVLKGDAPADETHDKVYGVNYAALPVNGSTHAGVYRAGGLWASDGATFKDWLEDERHIAVDAARKLKPQAEALAPAVAKPNQVELDRLEYLKAAKVMILTPHGGRPVWQYADSYGATIRDFERLGVEWDRRRVIGMSNIPKARNFLMAQFMAARTASGAPFTHALLIDDDMRWNPQSVLRLIMAQHEVIAAVGRKKIPKPNSDPSVWCFYAPPQALMEWDAMGSFTAEGTKAGAAFMVIQRQVIEKMTAAHPEWKRPLPPEIDPEIERHYYQLFRNDPDDLNDGGEDFCFCERWNALGGRVWIDPSIELGHIGETDYSGVLGELLQQHLTS